MATKNISVVRSDGVFYLHFDTDAITKDSEKQIDKLDCYEVALSREELKELLGEISRQ